MAYTQADLDRLDRAILQEETEVEVDGERVRYRTVRELIEARAHVAAALRDAQSAAAGTGGIFRFTPTLSRE